VRLLNKIILVLGHAGREVVHRVYFPEGQIDFKEFPLSPIGAAKA